MIKKCLICGKKVKTKLIKLPYTENIEKTMTYEFYKCCNYIKQKNFLNNKELSKLYSSSYLGYRKSKLWQLLKLLSTEFRILKYGKYIKDRNILELGCGMGDFINGCTKLNPKSVNAVEISSYACKSIKKNYPEINILNVDIENFLSRKKYDTIFLFHVIEHVKNPTNLIRNCKKMLTKKGVIIIETPNYDSWDRFIFKDKWFNYHVPYHTYLFSPLSFKKLSKQVNLHVVGLKGCRFPNTLSVQFSDIEGIWVIFVPLIIFLYILIYLVESFFVKSGVFSVRFVRK